MGWTGSAKFLVSPRSVIGTGVQARPLGVTYRTSSAFPTTTRSLFTVITFDQSPAVPSQKLLVPRESISRVALGAATHRDPWCVYFSILLSLSDKIVTVVKAPGMLQYTEQWHMNPLSHCRRYSCVDFSMSGNCIAFGGAGSLVLADACSGKTRAIVENQQANLVAVQWCLGEFAVCVYDNGTIVDVTITTVSYSRMPGRTSNNV